MLCDPVAIGTRARNVGASRAERAQASLGLVIGQERARRGRVERDAKGYNRFRLVIASRDAAAQSTAARAVFDAALGHDDKAHLHLVAGSEIPIALGIV